MHWGYLWCAYLPPPQKKIFIQVDVSNRSVLRIKNNSHEPVKTDSTSNMADLSVCVLNLRRPSECVSFIGVTLPFSSGKDRVTPFYFYRQGPGATRFRGLQSKIYSLCGYVRKIASYPLTRIG